MNLAQLRARCKSRFRDLNNSVYTDQEWTAYLNEAYDDITNDSPWWPFMQAKNTAVNYPAQAASIPLPGTDTWRVIEILDATDRYPLAPLFGGSAVFAAYPYADTTFGNPLHYRLFNNTLEVYPRPLVAITLNIEYMTPPLDLAADTDVPVFPAQYHLAIVSGALARAYEDDGNGQQSQIHWARLDEIVDDMKSDLLGARQETYPIIQDVWEWQ